MYRIEAAARDFCKAHNFYRIVGGWIAAIRHEIGILYEVGESSAYYLRVGDVNGAEKRAEQLSAEWKATRQAVERQTRTIGSLGLGL